MAYNLVTDKLYSVDFEELEIMFKRNNLLNFQHQDKWLNSWLEILKKADQDTNIQIENKNKHNLSFEGFEIFQKKNNSSFIYILFEFCNHRCPPFHKKNKPKNPKNLIE